MPLPPGHTPLDQGPIGPWGGRRFALVSTPIAQPTGRGNVPGDILAAVLLGHQVFCGASQGRDCARAQAERFQFIGRALPHGQAAITAAAQLGMEGSGTEGAEIGHSAARWDQGVPVVSIENERAPGADRLCRQNAGSGYRYNGDRVRIRSPGDALSRWGGIIVKARTVERVDCRFQHAGRRYEGARQ